MKRVYIQSEKELIYICEWMFRKFKTINVKWHRDIQWGNILTIYNQGIDKSTMVTCFRDLFIDNRLHILLQKKLENVFLFQDDAEINHIIQLVKQLIDEESIANEFSNKVVDIFEQYMQDTDTIYYDAMITFCSNMLAEPVEELTTLGVDEWKLEEAHQQFIASARHFLQERKIKTDVVHVMQGEAFQFYKMNGTLYTPLELKTRMLHTPLYQIGLDENEWNLAPVIALSPKNVFIYGDCPSEAKTISLINIFEGKAQFLPVHDFPFA